MNIEVGKISDSHGCESKHGFFMGCNAVQSDNILSTFRKCLVLPSSGR